MAKRNDATNLLDEQTENAETANADVQPVKRGRGRPKGSGKGSGATKSATPRQRNLIPDSSEFAVLVAVQNANNATAAPDNFSYKEIIESRVEGQISRNLHGILNGLVSDGFLNQSDAELLPGIRKSSYFVTEGGAEMISALQNFERIVAGIRERREAAEAALAAAQGAASAAGE